MRQLVLGDYCQAARLKNLETYYAQLSKRVASLESQQDLAKPKNQLKAKEIDLPDYLYRTWHALKKCGRAVQASEVAAITERARGLESSYLTRLWQMSLVSKKRVGKKIFYSL